MANDADLIFLPWVRRGGAAAVSEADSLGAGQRAVASATVRLEVEGGAPLSVPLRIMGPGHVTGLDPRQVIRTDPVDGTLTFEPNYLPLIELDEPALPWAFTPAKANSSHRLRPWICLVVVAKQPGVRLEPSRRGALPVLRIGRPARAAEELPDLAESWAWAHAQIAAEGGASAERLTVLLDGAPDRSLSRLLSGRVLRPETAYLACVVPTFEIGRKAGLGLVPSAADEARLEPAWTHSPELAAVELPVYYHWEFATGSGGDFQSLAMLLRRRELPEEVGRRAIDISRSGLDVPVADGTTRPLSGALKPLGTDPPAALDSTFRDALARLLNTSDGLAAEADPLLGPPRYGERVAGLRTLDPARGTRWYEQLNLDPVMRIAAQLGTRVVQENQEALMASAWEQSGELRRAGALGRLFILTRELARSLHARHLARMSPEAGLQVLAPAHARIRAAPDAAAPGTPLATELAASGVPPSAHTMALRRLARPRSALDRRLRRTTVLAPSTTLRRATNILEKLVPRQDVAGTTPVSATGPATFERVAAAMPGTFARRWNEATAKTIAAAPPQPRFGVESESEPRRPDSPDIVVERPATGPIRRPVNLPGTAAPSAPATGPASPSSGPAGHVGPSRPRDSHPARHFREAAKAHLARFQPPPPPRRAPTDGLFKGLEQLFARALELSDPEVTYERAARARIELGEQTAAEVDVLDTVRLTPHFPQPMAVPLAGLSQEYLLPGLETVPPNTVVSLETDSRFVDAYLVGLNAEMSRELLWREFPTPLMATYFDRFWDSGGDDRVPPDITPIAGWDDRPLGHRSDRGERFVLLLRSELLRRYPHAVIYAARPGPPPEERHPLFSGALDPDVRFFGFDIAASKLSDWSIVLQEQPSAPRFGIEVDESAGGASHLPAGDAHAADLAKRLRQLPVRITLPSDVLLAER